ncbi:MAG: hypothetical protein JWR75_1799 [Devosia sp.]|nr:hypothetical protein [Devosia sp.]
MRALLAALSVTMAFGSAAAVAQAPIEGVWRTPLEAEITIAPCGREWCGYLTKVVVPDYILETVPDAANMPVEELFDQRNPDPALRARKMLGLQILALHSGNGEVYQGEIYNPEEGKTYGGYLEVIGPDEVKLSGCVLLILCRGENWERVGGP